MKALKLLDFQYETLQKASDFSQGDICFLRSSPNVPFKIKNIKGGELEVEWEGCSGIESDWLPAHCFLQYKYASLVVFKRKYSVCLN
jgi:hypothetical protein